MAVTRWGAFLVLILSSACEPEAPPPPNPNLMRLELGAAELRLGDVLDRLEARRPPAERPALPRHELPARPRYATLERGETLSHLASRTLGSARRWREIADLNAIENPDAVPSGTRLRLPPE